MPPAAVKTVEELLYWQYSRLIAKSAGLANNYGFIMDRFKKFKSDEINWSTSIREYIKEKETENCIYCGSDDEPTLEHILPLSRGGPDEAENAIWICSKCNFGKGSKRLYEWFGLENRNRIPRIAEGKYLKLLYDFHKEFGTLAAKPSELCQKCDLGAKCPVKGKLSVFCLEGLFKKISDKRDY